MFQRMILGLLLLAGIAVNAQTMINLRGTVSNLAGKPIANAIVTLMGQKLKDTTGSDGAYKLSNSAPVVVRFLEPQCQTITLYKTFLDFSLPRPFPLKVEVFDVKGDLLKKEMVLNPCSGFYRFNIAEITTAANFLVIRAAIGNNQSIFHYVPLQNGTYKVGQSEKRPSYAAGALTKVVALTDTLKTTANGYAANIKVINSYDQTVDITLDTAGGDSVQPSAGCGKPRTLPDSSAATINVANGGGNRHYILSIPRDYDPNHPYALWFTIHGMGGNDEGVAHGSAGTNYQYFGMRKFANPANGKGTTIFCAPNGSGGGWSNGSGSDVNFFRAMITKFENELCIDKSRIFASGFSMGGSMSYALACAMPDTFRAVAMHSGGNMSGCDGSHRGPVPMFITHGKKDSRCTWPGYGQPQINDLATRNGCETIDLDKVCNPTDPTGLNPVCVEYNKCNQKYPCRACIFYDANQSPTGAHTPSPGPVKNNDWGEASTWVPDSTWSFFKRFY